jgi:hypothetical protein
VIVENLSRGVEQFEDRFVRDGIKDVQTIFSACHYVTAAQYTELLGQRALLDTESSAQFIYADLSTAQGVKNTNPEWMPQCFEELRLELRQFRHVCITNLIYYDLLVKPEFRTVGCGAQKLQSAYELTLPVGHQNIVHPQYQ